MKLTKAEEATACDFVAGWHTEQARLFCEIAKDEPRIDGPSRSRAAEAARHHAGSAAALHNKAADMRRLSPKEPRHEG